MKSRKIHAYPTHPVLPLVVALFLTVLLPLCASASVVRVDVSTREVVPGSQTAGPAGPYEIIKGLIHLEVDPKNPANLFIADLALAPVNHRGRVEFSTEFELHKPVDMARGNRRLLYFVNNRGNKHGEWHFNHGREGSWLYGNGWSYLWCGWIVDLPQSDRTLNINVPVLTDDGETITGQIYCEMINFEDDPVPSHSLNWGGTTACAPVSMDNDTATLTMRPYRWEEPQEVPRDRWSFARLVDGQVVPDPGHIYIKDGFKPGWLYDLVYVGKDPKPTGLGMAAIRDVASFFRYETADADGAANPLAGLVEHTYAWGHSQSARLLNHFAYQGFNADESRRIVFDGILTNCGGGGKGQFNSRFAQTTRHGSHHEEHLYPIDFFPFNSVPQLDPLTGRRDDQFGRARASGTMPKFIYLNSSTDYWTRASSLLHTDVLGTTDAAIDPSVRMFLVSGIAHTESRMGFVGRALLVALDRWVSHGIAPPDSEIPRIADGTLVSLDDFRKRFPEIPGVSLPDSFYHPYRLDPGPRWLAEGIADNIPPKTGRRYVCLVPQVDEDGNELAGVRLPDVAAPLATLTGWGLRNPSFSHTLGRNTGRTWPLPLTAEEGRQDGDSRKAVFERYPVKAAYLQKTATTLSTLVRKRLLLAEDVPIFLEEALFKPHWQSLEGASPLTIESAAFSSTRIPRGGESLILVDIKGSPEEILSVSATIQEVSGSSVPFNDSGTGGDGTAGDNVWTARIEIPLEAPPGLYHFDIEALDTNYLVIRSAAKYGGNGVSDPPLLLTIE